MARDWHKDRQGAAACTAAPQAPGLNVKARGSNDTTTRIGRAGARSRRRAGPWAQSARGGAGEDEASRLTDREIPIDRLAMDHRLSDKKKPASLPAFLLAGGQGFEPWLTESESAVLPLDDPPKELLVTSS